MRSYFLHGTIFHLSICMSVSKSSACFWKRAISIKQRNKLLIHNINLTGHRKSAWCLQLLVFLEIWIIASFWLCKTQVFAKGCCHHDLKASCETGYKSVLLNIIKKYKVNMIRILFEFTIYPSCEMVLKNWRMKSKIVRKLSFIFTFGQDSCLISGLARPNSDKAVLV